MGLLLKNIVTMLLLESAGSDVILLYEHPASPCAAQPGNECSRDAEHEPARQGQRDRYSLIEQRPKEPRGEECAHLGKALRMDQRPRLLERSQYEGAGCQRACSVDDQQD